MANFVEFVYQGVEREINTDLIFEIRKPWKADHPLGSGEGYWTTYQMLNGPVESFFFYNESEAQELYDKLRGKKNTPEYDAWMEREGRIQREYTKELQNRFKDLPIGKPGQVLCKKTLQWRDMTNEEVVIEKISFALDNLEGASQHLAIKEAIDILKYSGDETISKMETVEKKTETLSDLDQKVRDIMWTFQGMHYSDKLKYWKEYAYKVADIINTSKVICTHAKNGICYGCAMKKLGQIKEIWKSIKESYGGYISKVRSFEKLESILEEKK